MLLKVWSFTPACFWTLALMVMAFWPANTAVLLLLSWMSLLVVRGPPKAKMAALLMLIWEAAPMPLAVRPRLPPAAVMVPVKVFAEAGFRIQVPPSFLATLRVFALVALVLLVSTRFIWLLSVFEPRRSRVRMRAAESPRVVWVKVPVFQTRAPEPEASIR